MNKIFFADQFWIRYVSSRAKIIFYKKTNWLLANDRSESRLLASNVTKLVTYCKNIKYIYIIC